MRADGVETHVVSSSGVSDSTSYCHAAALCEPLFRLKMEFSKGFHSLENHVSTGGQWGIQTGSLTKTHCGPS